MGKLTKPKRRVRRKECGVCLCDTTQMLNKDRESEKLWKDNGNFPSRRIEQEQKEIQLRQVKIGWRVRESRGRNRQKNRESGVWRQKDRKTERQRDRETESRQIDRQID